MDDLKKTVAKNIAELRLAKKMTQLELGNALSYSDKAVSKWERGEGIPDAYVLLAMSKLFGVSVDYILTDHGGEIPKEITKKEKPPTNHTVITLITVVGIWTLASLVYVILNYSGIKHPLTFVYALPTSFLVVTILNSIWGNKRFNLIYVSGFVLSIIFMIFLIFLFAGHNLWQILLLGIPTEIIVLLCFGIRLPKFSKKKTGKE